MSPSARVRDALASALALDLVGPEPSDAGHAEEVLAMAPAVWYLTGFLVPFDAPHQDREGDDADGELDAPSEPGSGDDAAAPEVAAARKGLFPSSMGMTVLVPPETRALHVQVSWGDYTPLAAPTSSRAQRSTHWRRSPRQERVPVPLPTESTEPAALAVPHSDGLELAVAARPVQTSDALPPGTRAVSIFLVNRRKPVEGPREQSWAFQTHLRVDSDADFVARPDHRSGEDWDDRVADLQYRDAVEHAVGHNVSVHAICQPDGTCRSAETTWLPRASVARVVPGQVADVELAMEALAAKPSGQAAADALAALPARYSEWITRQPRGDLGPAPRPETAVELLNRAEDACRRISAGISLLASDPLVWESFRLANHCIAVALRQRAGHDRVIHPQAAPAPAWRPFQLAFILMNLAGLADPLHGDRQIVDLLFFPTGGGKTEAYLGLAAFALVHRRLKHPGLAGAGVGVLMRYTLRLLTLDQLGRAATLICALEIERQKDPQRLGPWPFEIGLWVGQSATPNEMGSKGDSRPTTARARVLAYQRDDRRHPSPIPLENCPWCGSKFASRSFRLVPTPDQPRALEIRCIDRDCLFTRNAALPIVAIDEPLYRRLPAFIIATVDKFAALPWVGQTGALLGKADRADADGFYGPSEPGRGRPLPHSLLPPELIIQDELHLISGPLGTMVGLYETAIDAICERRVGDVAVRPKIIASTATVRRAERQIQALFGRTAVEIFPPPGPDRADSFFARTLDDPDQARLYLGVASQGRSLKVVLLRSYLALMAAAQRQYDLAGGKKNPDNPADPYMTLLGYFNSLRELGGSRRIVEDEVNARLAYYNERRRDGEASGSFADRKIDDLPQELTSRVRTSEVAETKRRLGLGFADKERVDVALATNMISVGLDIVRLGLMVVLGQPKTASEYIQATSRVGRDPARRPGLVVALLNVHRPRDRSHYEHFAAWHESFYRSVEATSVTPFSPPARARGLAGVAVALGRHLVPALTPARGALQAAALRPKLDLIADILADRADRHDLSRASDERARLRLLVRGEAQKLLDTWARIAHDKQQVNAGLQYQREAGSDQPLLHQPDDPELAKLPAEMRRFTAARSLRDVEPTVDLFVRTPDGFLVEVAADEESAS
ncbi:MAG: helicase [Nannocystis sp.]|nr:helicase [Nannocystis sp.]